MAKKLDEKELNNVSGGCGDKAEKWDYKLAWFDYSDNQVGPVYYYSAKSPSEAEVKKVLKEECNKIFKENINIYKIKYLTIKNDHGHAKGTMYRN